MNNRLETQSIGVQTDKSRLMPLGTLNIYTENMGATGSFTNTAEDLLRRVADMNTVEYIEPRFFTVNPDQDDSSMIYRVFHLMDRSRVSVMKPTSRYGHLDTQVNASLPGFSGNGFKLDENGYPIPDMLADHTQDAQIAYVAASLALLKEGEGMTGKHEKVINMENVATALAPYSSRSIGLIHKHHAIIDTTKINLKKIIVPGLDDEAAIMADQAFVDLGLNHLVRTLTTNLEALKMPTNDFSVIKREIPPYGFSLVFDKNAPVTVDNLTQLSNVMRIFKFRQAVQASYAATAKRFERIANGSNILERRYGIVDPEDHTQKAIPHPNRVAMQPSHRELEDITPDGHYRLTLVPAIRSRGGPVESAGNVLNRTNDAEYNTGVDPIMESSVYEQLAEQAEKLVEQVARVRSTEKLPRRVSLNA